jgi:hypothetical protein
MSKHWDRTENLAHIFDDGGRAAAGYRGQAGDCVVRAVAIASGRPYADIYAELSLGMGAQRKSKGATARNGVNVRRKWFRDYMASLGFQWVPTMFIGQGCKTHLLKDELPTGRLVVAVSKHYTAVIDGVIHDTHDPSRTTLYPDEQGRAGGGYGRMTHRCVYGYWMATKSDAPVG